MWNRTQACEPGRHFLLLLEVVNSLPQPRDPLERKGERGRERRRESRWRIFAMPRPPKQAEDGRRDGGRDGFIHNMAGNKFCRSLGRWASESAPFPVQICDRSCNTEHAAAAATTGDRTSIKGRGNTSRSLSAA